MITPRAITPEDFHRYRDQTFWWAGHGGRSRDELEKLRAVWARMQNEALEGAGSFSRVDHRSLASQLEEALVRSARALDAGNEEAAWRHALRAEALTRAPQKPRGRSPTVQAMGRVLERKLRYQWARLRRRAEDMMQGVGGGMGGDLLGVLAHAAGLMLGHAHDEPACAPEVPPSAATPWRGWEPGHGR